MPAYTVMYQYLNADFSEWIHAERTVTALDSKEALKHVVQAVQLKHPGRKCGAKQIRKAKHDLGIATTAKSIAVGRFTIVQAEPNRAVCLHRDVGQPNAEAMESKYRSSSACTRHSSTRRYELSVR